MTLRTQRASLPLRGGALPLISGSWIRSSSGGAAGAIGPRQPLGLARLVRLDALEIGECGREASYARDAKLVGLIQLRSGFARS
jgi:hypothetical protein